ncbi:TetR/AcrR family transcriptional regulator [Actinomadura sp. WMMB 499]|uniref:TetR/AcrR family transcriptional regulator n=1 Tax=Actinomadura sp. WMMB 499 TaxID=1219491 RepID=UPI001245BE94|nr:TetR/AcrR family transcriptional regulator [Actinomadura sp. WMMB 499]QFG20765.1 TetR/AcrR family transcriptional regulator [Actinomadura sp. WMMB 499]
MTTEHGDHRDPQRSLKLLWGDRARPPRGRPPTLTLEAIVAAAVETADELARTEGLEALTMRSIATRLGVGTMSLYRYVPGKGELLDLMLDHVIGEYEPAEEEHGPSGWRDVLAGDAHRQWRMCMEHPWYPFVDQSRPILGPNSLHGLDRVLGLLRPIGVPDRTLMMMIGTQSDYVDGVARSCINERRAVERTGLSGEDFWAAQAPTLEKAVLSGRFPAMAAADENTFDWSYEQIFEFGLNRLHDGFASFLGERSG